MPATMPDASDRIAKAVVLVAPYWPSDDRHKFYLALAGGLCRDEIAERDALAIVEQIAVATNDDKREKRLPDTHDTYATIRKGAKATGWSKLAQFFDARCPQIILNHGASIVRKFRHALGTVNTRAELACLLAMSLPTLDRLCAAGRIGLRKIVLGVSSPRWHLDEFKRWIEGGRRPIHAAVAKELPPCRP
jgi:hypothetical protein